MHASRHSHQGNGIVSFKLGEAALMQLTEPAQTPFALKAVVRIEKMLSGSPCQPVLFARQFRRLQRVARARGAVKIEDLLDRAMQSVFSASSPLGAW